MLSPTLFHNICPSGCGQILVRVSPYGTRDPGIPTARSVALARVASPFSIHRRYEPLFIDALREYFGSAKRLVKGGDIIPLQINIDRSLDSHCTLGPGDFTSNIAHSRSVVAIYFVVQNVDYESPAVQARGQPFPIPNVGCLVDANVTEIIQVGIEHVRVPDVYDYHDLRWVSFRSFLLLRLTCPFRSFPGGVPHSLWNLSPDLSVVECHVALRSSKLGRAVHCFSHGIKGNR